LLHLLPSAEIRMGDPLTSWPPGLSPNVDPSRTESRCQMYRVPRFKPGQSDARMFTSLMMLAAEANSVVALRMMKLMRGGNGARSDAKPPSRDHHPAEAATASS
jgi:hypothetical protein